jgi:hypothetical protein
LWGRQPSGLLLLAGQRAHELDAVVQPSHRRDAPVGVAFCALVALMYRGGLDDAPDDASASFL